MTKKTWTIIGVGDFIHEIVEIIQHESTEITYCVLAGNKDEHRKKDLPQSIQLITFDNLSQLQPTDYYCFGVINLQKEPLLEKLTPILTVAAGTTDNFSKIFPNIIHPKAIISPSTTLGYGNFLGAGSILGSFATVGNFNFFNRGSTVGHDTQIGNFNHLAPAATVCGLVTIGNNTTIGANATVIDEIHIGDNSMVGAGAAVVEHLQESGTYVGVPAKRLIKS
ncbi:MAG TPA: acetyltransferase [Candidatus Woesebacteria bacterium]|nr:acetyltransferase [Candidatus Woesebacteria bacterium]